MNGLIGCKTVSYSSGFLHNLATCGTGVGCCILFHLVVSFRVSSALEWRTQSWRGWNSYNSRKFNFAEAGTASPRTVLFRGGTGGLKGFRFWFWASHDPGLVRFMWQQEDAQCGVYNNITWENTRLTWRAQQNVAKRVYTLWKSGTSWSVDSEFWKILGPEPAHRSPKSDTWADMADMSERSSRYGGYGRYGRYEQIWADMAALADMADMNFISAEPTSDRNSKSDMRFVLSTWPPQPKSDMRIEG